MKFQFDFVAHPGHLIRGDFNLCVLGCVPAMVTGDATTAANDFVWTFGCSFSGDDAAVEGAALRAFHEKWEKNGTVFWNLQIPWCHWAENSSEYDIREIDEDLYLQVLTGIKQLWEEV
jgi:hypothetical protein